jgi:uncharacterized membrane protein
MANERASRPMLVLSYLAFLGVIPLLFARQDPDVRWHARNGLFLFAEVAVIALVAIFAGALLPALGLFSVILMYLVLLLYTFIVILAIVKALDGQRLLVPGISRRAGRG